jgi:hypothetical protein
LPSLVKINITLDNDIIYPEMILELKVVGATNTINPTSEPVMNNNPKTIQ